MKKFLLSLAAVALCSTAYAGQVQEVLTVDKFGDLAANSYVDVAYTSTTTGITYKGNMTKSDTNNGSCMQFRSSKSVEGLVITANPKSAVFKSIEVEYYSTTTAARTLDVYGKATAYTAATQLYATAAGDQGTKIGSIKKSDTSHLLNAPAEPAYNFIGFRSNSGAMYITKITITYEIAGEEGKKSADLAFAENSFTVKMGDAFTAPVLTKATNADVVYSTSNAEVADVVASTGVVTITGVGTATITAKTAENDTYYAGEASYTINVIPANTILYSPLGADFTLENPADIEVWKQDATYGLKGTSYIGGKNNAAEAYAISPVIDLTSYKDVKLNFKTAANFFSSVDVVPTECTVVAREEGATEWTKVGAATAPAKLGWDFIDNDEIDLAAYNGKKMQFAYKYTSTATKSGTWEVKEIMLTGTNTGVGIVDAIEDDVNAPVRYFNLQGVEIANPTEGLFIRVQGKKATKVIIRK